MILREQATAIAQPFGHHFEHRARERQRHFLIEPRHRYAAQLHHGASVGHLRAIEHFHECALAGAITAQQTDALPPLDGKIGVIEHGGTPEGDTDVLQ